MTDPTVTPDKEHAMTADEIAATVRASAELHAPVTLFTRSAGDASYVVTAGVHIRDLPPGKYRIYAEPTGMDERSGGVQGTGPSDG